MSGATGARVISREQKRGLLLAWATSHRPAFLSLLVVALLYLIALLLMPPEGLTQHDTGAKYLQVRNLRLTSTGLDWSINYPARSLDPDLRYVPFHPKQRYIEEGQRIYLQWPIFLGLLTRIPWKALGFWGLYVVPLLAGLGAIWATYKLSLAVGVPRNVAWLAVPLLGLATPVSIYSLLFFEHTLATLLVAVSLLAALSAVNPLQDSTKGAVLSGALLAVGIYFRSELYVLALVLGMGFFYVSWRRRRWHPLVGWAAGFGAALLPLWIFYSIRDGSILPLHAMWYFAGREQPTTGGPSISLPPLRYLASAGWGIVPDFLLGPQGFPLSPRYSIWAEMAGVVGVALCGMSALGRLVRRASERMRLLILAVGLLLILFATLPTLLSTQPYQNLHGFLLAAPFVAIALWPPSDGHRKGVEASNFLYAVVFLHLALHALIISALSGLGPISRHEWGQRYLLPAYPGLVALGLYAAWRIWQLFASERGQMKVALACVGLFGALALAGLGFTIRGYAILSDERGQVAAWQRLARSMPDREPLVTDLWWLPLNLSADFYTRPMMLAEGEGRMAEWASDMGKMGVSSLGLMSNNTSIFAGEWSRRTEGLRADGPMREVRGMWLQRYLLDAR